MAFSGILGVVLFIVGHSYAAGAGLQANGSGFDPGEVSLRWTAPGDDGYSGRAAGYDLRYQPYSVGPINTEAEWINATRAVGEPSPSPAGQVDSMVITGLEYGAIFYFCIKAFDSAGNYSVMSNSPIVAAGDTISCSYLPGDANGDASVDMLDILFLVGYLYKRAPAPDPLMSGNMDADPIINMLDAICLIQFLFKAGPPPICLLRL
jgi:hypothetical protein